MAPKRKSNVSARRQGKRARVTRSENRSNVSGDPDRTDKTPETRPEPEPLIPLDLIRGRLPAVQPVVDGSGAATGLQYVPIVKGPGDRQKRYDVTRIIVVHPGQPYEPLICTIKVRVLPLLDAAGEHKRVEDIGMQHDDFPMDEYVALSYAWEDQKRDEKILIEHTAGLLTFWITYNLKSALVALRHPKDHRNFWADAISMDQGSDAEKSQQLPLMSRIYSEAIKVCVWLSDKQEDVLEGLNFTKNIITKEAFTLMGKIREWKKFRTVVEEDTTCAQWLAFMWLMTRPWFQRRWVVQEIVLARQSELRCASQRISWTEFAQAVSIFEFMEEKVKKLFRKDEQQDQVHDKFGAFREYSASRLVQVTANIVSRRDDGRVVRKVDSLENLISTLTPFKAGDPKDIVYAILSLAKDVSVTAADVKFIKDLELSDLTEEQRKRKDANKVLLVLNRIMRNMRNDRFPVDYRKDFDEICHDLYFFTMLHSRSLDLICRPWCPKNEDGRVVNCPRILPTWVRSVDDVAWRLDGDGNMQRINADTLVGNPGSAPYQASANLRPIYSFERAEGEEGRYILSAWGFQLDSISGRIETPATAGVLPASWLKYKAPQNDLPDGTTATLAGSADQISMQFCMTMIAGKGVNGQNPPLCYPLLFQETFNTNIAMIIPQMAKETTNTILKEFLNRVFSVICERRLAKTSRHGRLALLPKETEVNDVICILYGCSVPVVLRQTASKTIKGDDIWELIGECYVHDMMSGQGLSAQQLGSKKDPEFYRKRHFKIR